MKRRLSRIGVIGNSLVAALGSAAAALAAVPSLWPAAGAAVVGAIVAFTATNEIRRSGD